MLPRLYLEYVDLPLETTVEMMMKKTILLKQKLGFLNPFLVETQVMNVTDDLARDFSETCR